MPTITDKPSIANVAQNVALDRANSALVLGSKVLAELSGADATTTMNVPAQVLKDLASAVVFLAAGIQAGEAQETSAPAASTSPRVDASFKIFSGYNQSGLAHQQLTEAASTLREKAVDLGLKMGFNITAPNGTWQLVMSGDGPKDRLEALKEAAQAAVSSLMPGSAGRVEVQKYELL
jgi:hypothetical protein